MELEQELERNNWLKVLINANWKKILLVERLIGTEKRREIYIISEYMVW